MEFATRQAKSAYNELRRRRVLKVHNDTRPLFVSEVQYKSGRFSRGKPCLLVVTAAAVAVLDVQSQGELEARDGSHASIQLAVRASEVVGVAFVPGGLRLEYKTPGALKVSPAVFGLGPSESATPIASFAAAASAGGGAPAPAPPALSRSLRRVKAYGSADGAFPGPDREPADGTASGGGGSPRSLGRGGSPRAGAGTAAATAAAAAAEAVHQVDYCTLLFGGEDAAELARSAAAAVVYARSVDADASRWIACGLPTNFAIEMAFAALQPPPPPLGGAGGPRRAAGKAPPPPPLGGEAVLGPGPWGASVQLPGAWSALLSRSAAQAAGGAHPAARALSGQPGLLGPAEHCGTAGAAPPSGDTQQRRRQREGNAWQSEPAPPGLERMLSRSASAVLTRARELAVAAAAASSLPRRGAGAAAAAAAAPPPPGGPGALVVCFSTPLGLAAATVKPEHLVALQRDSRLDGVLAVPVSAAGPPQPAAQEPPGSGSSPRTTAQGGRRPPRIGGGSASGGSSSGGAVSGGGGASGAWPQPCFTHRVVDALGPREPGSSAPPGGSGPAASAAAGGSGSDLESISGASSTGGGSCGGAVDVQHSQAVYAVLHISLSSKPPPPAPPKPPKPQKPQPPPAAAAAAQPALARARARWWRPAPERVADVARAFVIVAVFSLLHGALFAPSPACPVSRLLAAVSSAEALGSCVMAGLWASCLVALLGTLRDLRPPAAGGLAGGGAAAVAAGRRGPSARGGPFASAAATEEEEEDEEGGAGSPEVWSVCILGASLYTQPDAYVQAQVKEYKAAAAAAASAAAAEEAAAPTEGAGEAAAAGTEDAVRPLGREARRLPLLISDPEPSWLTPDVIQRFVQAKPTLKASQDQAVLTHKWRQRLGVDTILERPPGPSYEFVKDHFRTYLMSVTSSGDPVLLVKLCDMKRLGDAVRAGKGSLRDLEEHLAFMNEYMYTVAAPSPLPGGLGVQIIDCAGAKLSMITSDAIAAFKVFASFGLYYPERLAKAIVVNAPSWFDMPWRIASAILDENTRSKVVLEFDTRKVAEALEEVMGPDQVPAEYGGPCTTTLDSYPEMIKLEAFVKELRNGGRPYSQPNPTI